MIKIKTLVIIDQIHTDSIYGVTTFRLAPIKVIEGSNAFLGNKMEISLVEGSKDALYMQDLFLNKELLEMTFSGVSDKKILPPPPPPNTGGIIKKGI